jgi:hypothetical protein
MVTAGIRVSWEAIWLLALPCALLIVGGLIGYPFSLDQPIAAERLLGLVAAGVIAMGATLGLRQITDPVRPLVVACVVALAGGVWVIAASGPDVFRGAVGNALDVIFRPLFGVVRLTDPVEVSNTRFIVGYNGLADLCLVAIFACGALLLQVRHRVGVLVLSAVLAASLVLVVGTGARGAVTGLAAGVCLAGISVWPRRYALVALVAIPVALVAAAAGVLDKGLEFSSTAGRLTYWGDLARLLVEYPLTGVGLGVDTANAVALQYEINPDPERVFYAHNTFVQAYLELGPLGMLGMLLVPLVAFGAAVLARRHGESAERRAFLGCGLGVIGGLEAHGLTDQVVTTNVGTGLLFIALAAVLASLGSETLSTLSVWTRRAAIFVMGVVALCLVAFVATPAGRAQALLNLGALEMDRAFALPAESEDRTRALTEAEGWFKRALDQDTTQPAVLRDLAWVGTAHYDDAAALQSLKLAADSPRIDAFDMLQIAHVYRDLGFVDDAYTWAARAYAQWGRPPEDAVMQRYAQSTLNDSRARTLADQAEAAMRARHFGDAQSLFGQAQTFEPSSVYLRDRLGASQRAIDKYGAG